jgi:transcriptional regulator with XRE-family HTH domain
MSGKPTESLFDAPRFASWLRRWKEAEGLEWGDIAKKGGLSTSALHELARGTPRTHGTGRDRAKGINPSVTIMARVAMGLGLDLGYVLSKAGLGTGSDRWSNFSRDDRRLLVAALRDSALRYSTLDDQLPPPMLALLREIEASLTDNEEPADAR